MRVVGGEKERNVGEVVEKGVETGVVVEGEEEEKEGGVKRGKR